MTPPKEPVLTATARLAPDTLVLGCRVRNATDTEYGLFARIPETFPDGCLRLSPHVAYVELADGVLRVAKCILPVPEGLNVAGRQAPLAVRVPAGAEWEEEIHLPIPVRVCHPYRRALIAAENPGADVNPQEPKAVKDVEVIFGAFPITPEVNLAPASPAFPTVFRVWPPGVAAARQVLLVRRLTTPAEVLVLDYGVTKPG
jgi:hypothetical protein